MAITIQETNAESLGLSTEWDSMLIPRSHVPALISQSLLYTSVRRCVQHAWPELFGGATSAREEPDGRTGQSADRPAFQKVQIKL